MMLKSPRIIGLPVWTYTTTDVSQVLTVEERLYAGTSVVVLMADLVQSAACAVNNGTILQTPTFLLPKGYAEWANRLTVAGSEGETRERGMQRKVARVASRRP
jgi:hypothetical protein